MGNGEMAKKATRLNVAVQGVGIACPEELARLVGLGCQDLYVPRLLVSSTGGFSPGELPVKETCM